MQEQSLYLFQNITFASKMSFKERQQGRQQIAVALSESSWKKLQNKYILFLHFISYRLLNRWCNVSKFT